MRPSPVLSALPFLLGACSFSEPPLPPVPPAPAGIPIESAVFPVVLADETYLHPVICRNPAELRARRDFEAGALATTYRVIDSAGTVFRPRRPQIIQEAPGLLTRLFTGTFYTSAPVRVDFQLSPDGNVTNRGFWKSILDGGRDPRPCGGTRDMPLPDLFRHLAAPLCVPWHNR